MRQKRIAAIHDLSCLGKCSLTVVLPVISCLGVECAVLPTALLSSHFAVQPQVQVWELTEQMRGTAECWLQGGWAFDGIFSGYLGSAAQVAEVQSFAERFRHEDTLFVADPAMADRGVLYRGFDQSHVEAMARLCAGAQVTMPNVTEAAMMLGETCRADSQDPAYIRRLARGMCRMGAERVILTGVSVTPGMVGVACCDGGEPVMMELPRTPGHYCGTGDLFGAVASAAMVQGWTLPDAARLAMEFTAHVIARTAGNPDRRPYAVDFEWCLPWLMERWRESGCHNL